MPEPDLAQLARRLQDGEWLQIGEVAALLNVSRNTVHRRIADGTISVRTKAGSNWRLLNPADVLRLLEESVKEHRASD